jgi:antitoxin component of MazEF toxin-antitoxin module
VLHPRKTVAFKNKAPVIVPAAALRRAGFKRGQELEVKASGGIITIVPKLSVDERDDYLELRNPGVRRQIEQSNADLRAGRTRPAAKFLAELKTTRKPRRRG